MDHDESTPGVGRTPPEPATRKTLTAERREATGLREAPADAALAPIPTGTDTRVGHVRWSREQIDLIKRECAPDTTDNELLLFLAAAERSGLDPIAREIYCMVYTGKRRRLVIHAGIDGLRRRAESFHDFRGCTFAAVREGDPCIIDASAGTVAHSFDAGDPARQKKRILGAWARVRREGRDPVVVWIWLHEFIKVGTCAELWDQKTEVMVCKVAQHVALRTAYPTPFARIYGREEFAAITGAGPEGSDSNGTEPTDVTPAAPRTPRHPRGRVPPPPPPARAPAEAAAVGPISPEPKVPGAAPTDETASPPVSDEAVPAPPARGDRTRSAELPALIEAAKGWTDKAGVVAEYLRGATCAPMYESLWRKAVGVVGFRAWPDEAKADLRRRASEIAGKLPRAWPSGEAEHPLGEEGW